MQTYRMDGQELASVELKSLVVSRGVRVSDAVYRKYSGIRRLHKDPERCNTMILPDSTIVQLTDLSFHMGYVKKALSWDMLRQLRYFRDLKTGFTLELNDEGRAELRHNGIPVVEVEFPKPTDFYERKTSRGLPYLGHAVLQGTEWLSWQYLWNCEYACSGHQCEYCYSGGVSESRARRGKPLPRFATPEDAAEMAWFAIREAGLAKSLQITGGSSFDPDRECRHVLSYLDAIMQKVGKPAITGEVLVYMTPPGNPALLDRIFEAGADRISCSLEIWDEALAARIMPGKARYTGRARHLAALEHIARRFGPGKACSNFLVGVEPADKVLEGAEYLASRGIVPSASVWIPFGRPVQGTMRGQSLAYYRRIIEGYARILETYHLDSPGGTGLNVCMDREIWRDREFLARRAG